MIGARASLARAESAEPRAADLIRRYSEPSANRACGTITDIPLPKL